MKKVFIIIYILTLYLISTFNHSVFATDRYYQKLHIDYDYTINFDVPIAKKPDFGFFYSITENDEGKYSKITKINSKNIMLEQIVYNNKGNIDVHLYYNAKGEVKYYYSFKYNDNNKVVEYSKYNKSNILIEKSNCLYDKDEKIYLLRAISKNNDVLYNIYIDYDSLGKIIEVNKYNSRNIVTYQKNIQYYPEKNVIVEKFANDNGILMKMLKHISDENNKLIGRVEYDGDYRVIRYFRYFYNEDRREREVNQYDRINNLLSVSKIFYDENGYKILTMNFDANMNFLSATKYDEWEREKSIGK